MVAAGVAAGLVAMNSEKPPSKTEKDAEEFIEFAMMEFGVYDRATRP
jgi:hypothetical protein